MISAEGDIGNLERAWSETANEMKAMQKILQEKTTCIGHLQQNRSPQPIPPTNNENPINQGNNNTQRREGGEVKIVIKTDLPFAGGARAM